MVLNFIKFAHSNRLQFLDLSLIIKLAIEGGYVALFLGHTF